MRNRSATQTRFAEIPQVNIGRSVFKRSRKLSTAFYSAYLIPIFMDEALPGDTFNVELSSVCRLSSPLDFPIMDNMQIDYFFFSCANRLLWENWDRFMGERRPDPDSSIDYTVPIVTAPGGGYAEESLFDYMGIPIGVASIEINALHSRMYNKVWNEWFRSQDLQDSVTVDVDDGPDTDTDYVLLKRGKRHDYFTAALPYLNKGGSAAEIDLPLGTQAPVVGDGTSLGLVAGGAIGSTRYGMYMDSLGDLNDDTSKADVSLPDSGAPTGSASSANYALGVTKDPDYSGIYADLTTATAATIAELREAMMLQRMLEIDSRSGTRYVESVKAHFGVDMPHALYRSEYLGGGSCPIIVSPVTQQSQTDTTNQGHLTAIAFHQQSGIGFTKSFTEHSTILGLACVRADMTYQQGIPRMWSRQEREDFFFPSLQFLSEQAILNKEIYAQGTSADDEVFGYIPRYDEYRYSTNMVTGPMRSAHSTPLDSWHLALDFASLPSLNASFIVEAPPIQRVIAVPSEPEFIFDGYFQVINTRPMAAYSIPGLTSRF